MLVDLFWVKYEDKHTSAIVFKKIQESSDKLGIACAALEKINSKSRRTRSTFRLLIGVLKEKAQDLPALLKVIKNSLEGHELYEYLSFDCHITPIISNGWNLDSYDDRNYQEIFKNKRKGNI